MNNIRVSLLCLSLLPSSLLPVSAQTTPAPVPSPAETGACGLAGDVPRIDPSIVHHDVGPDGALWSRGATFKLRMDASGAIYVPFFGSRAPQNYPVHMALSAANVGGEPLPIDARAEPVRTGDVVRFDRGAIVETYEIAPKGIEQVFVIESLPASGDLALRVSVETELASRAAGGGFEFANEFGAVRCGAATAIDARGRSLRLESEFEGGEMLLHVPASFVAEAEFPLVVDPLWFTVDIEYGLPLASSPEIAHPNGGYLFVCWEEAFSSTDHDVWGELIDGGGGVYSSFAIDSTTDNWTRPRAGHLSRTDTVLVVAEVGAAGSRAIWDRAISVGNPWSAGLQPQREISESWTPGEKFHAEVGGDPFPHWPSWFLVVYEYANPSGDHDIYGVMIGGDGQQSSSTLGLVQNASTDDEAPAISRTDDSVTATWNIVWQRSMTFLNHDIYAMRVYYDGSVIAAPFPLPASSTDEINPTVSGPLDGTNRFMAAWQRRAGFGFGSDYDIAACLVDGSTPLDTQLLPWTGAQETLPAIESNARHFVCAYVRGSAGQPSDVIAAEIQPYGNKFQVGESLTLAGQAADETTPRVTCHEDSDPDHFTTLYFVIHTRGTDVAMAAYIGLEGGSIQSFCRQIDANGVNCPCGQTTGNGGCPNSATQFGATLSASGVSSTQSDTLNFDFAGMPANVSCLVFQGTTIGNSVFGDGLRCIGTPTVRFPVLNANALGTAGYGAGYGSVPISVRGGVPLIGGTFYYQVWYRDPASFCTAATTNLTNALRVIWTP